RERGNCEAHYLIHKRTHSCVLLFIHDSRVTTHSRFTIHDCRFTLYIVLYDELCPCAFSPAFFSLWERSCHRGGPCVWRVHIRCSFCDVSSSEISSSCRYGRTSCLSCLFCLS